MFARRTIKSILIGIVITLAAIITIEGVASFTIVQKFNDQLELLSTNAFASVVLLDDLRKEVDASAGRISSASDASSAEDFAEDAAHIEAQLGRVKVVVGSDEEHAIYQRLVDSWRRWKAIRLDYLTGKRPRATAITRADTELSHALDQMVSFNTAEANSAEQHGQQLVTITRLGVLGLMTIGIAIACWASGILFRRVLAPFGKLTEIAVRMGEGDIDLEVPQTRSNDELGALARAIDGIRRHSAARVRGEAEAASRAAAADLALAEERNNSQQARLVEAEERDQRARALELLAARFSARANDLLATVTAGASALRGTARAMNGVAETTSVQAAAVVAASEGATQNIDAIAKATNDLVAAIQAIEDQVTRQARITSETSQRSTTASDRMSALAIDAANAMGILDIIADIAKQTGLLALNASIEAARAGDSGRGFAIVAAEVKALAIQTQNAAETVSHRLAAMQAATVTSSVAVREIEESLDELTSVGAAIVAAIRRQSQLTIDIARNADEAVGGAQGVASSLGQVRRMTADTDRAAESVLGAATDLSAQADAMKDEVAGFLAQVTG